MLLCRQYGTTFVSPIRRLEVSSGSYILRKCAHFEWFLYPYKMCAFQVVPISLENTRISSGSYTLQNVRISSGSYILRKYAHFEWVLYPYKMCAFQVVPISLENARISSGSYIPTKCAPFKWFLYP